MAPQAVQSDGQTMFFEYQAESGRWTWSRSLRDLHGLAPGQEPTTELLLDSIVDEDRPEMLARFRGHLDNAGPFSCVYRMTDPAGQLRRVVFVAQSEAVVDVVKRLTGFVVDITEPLRDSARAAVAASSEHQPRTARSAALLRAVVARSHGRSG